MDLASTICYPAVAVVQQGYMTRLALTEPSSAFHWNILLSRVPQVVDEALVTLDTALLDSLPNIVVNSGKALVQDRVLVVYHTYSNKTSDADNNSDADDSDAVVVGLSVERSDSSVMIRSDAVSEETGSVFFELTTQSHVGDDASILEKVKIAAEQLASQPNIIAQAIANL